MPSSTSSILTSDNSSLFFSFAQILGFWVGSVLPQSPRTATGASAEF